MTVLLYANRTVANAFATEIAATPQIENGVSPVWLWYDPDQPANAVVYAESTDGRCAQSHPFDEATHDWLAIQAEGHPGVTVGNALPADWEWPEVE